MKERRPEIVEARRSDGTTTRIVVPQSRVDVEQQPTVPAHALALLAFSTVKDGVRRWSDFTALVLKQLQRNYGDDAVRSTLCGLLDDINSGFRPTNPIGLLIHRTRATAHSSDLTI